jgi:FtsH-binding integral membrane protein
MAPTGNPALTRDQTSAMFGPVMGLVALTVGCTALGAYIGRNFSGGSGLLFIIVLFGCVIGLQAASARGHQQLATVLLFGLGLALGIFLGPVLSYYLKADPDAVYQSAGSTGLFVAGLGAYGYATRRDLSSWYRGLFFALIGLIIFGLVAVFVAIPGGNIIWSVAGLVIFGGFTIIDFNRLARRGTAASAVPIAASIFLDIFNIFLFFLSLFGGGSRR